MAKSGVIKDIKPLSENNNLVSFFNDELLQ
jgi:hypothetical protein